MQHAADYRSPDAAPLGRFPARPPARPVLDDGRYRAALAAGRPERRALFTGADGPEPAWPDGQREEVDAIVLATGYRPDLPYLTEHRFAALDADGTVLGWVAASRISDRCAYAGVVEHSVYVHPAARGRGVATALLKELVDSTERAGIWTIQSGIFPENTASLAVHQRAGFRVIGTRERIGRHHGVWRDVVLVERRSPAVT